MVKSYCVRQKKQTECVPGSERYVKAKNGRMMLKCTCAECGITKTKFVKSQSGGASKKASTGPYCGANKLPKGRQYGQIGECYDKHQIRLYGLNKVPKEIIETLQKSTKKAKRKNKGN